MCKIRAAGGSGCRVRGAEARDTEEFCRFGLASFSWMRRLRGIGFDMMNKIQRLGKNRGGYFGERADMRAVLGEVEALAEMHGWRIERMPVAEGVSLLALRRGEPEAPRKIYVSAGIHGDEPAGPLAVRQLLAENRWPVDAEVWLCPCLNPVGFERGVRENADGADLNRDYRDLKTAEIRAHVQWLEQQPRFDFALCLHEDWESHGFYLYERNRDRMPPLAPRIIGAVERVCPIDESPEIEGRAALHGVIDVNDEAEARELWPETLYLTVAKTAQSCTLEAPSDFPLAVRVAALVTAVRAVVG
jgi:protein MpaA